MPGRASLKLMRSSSAARLMESLASSSAVGMPKACQPFELPTRPEGGGNAKQGLVTDKLLGLEAVGVEGDVKA